MKRALLLLLLTAACATAPPKPASQANNNALPLWGGLTPGSHPVGFVSSTIMADPHPLQVSVWYPSGNDGVPLHYRDYLALNITETQANAATSEQKQATLADAKAFLTKNGISAASADALINAPMYAHANAQIAAGSYPLVFVVQGNGQSASGQAVMCEYLASHGYVVATIPSVTRITGPMKDEKEIAAKAQEEMDNIGRAIGSLAQWGDIKRDVPVAFVAHSFGARGALFYAMHNPVSAFVSLEGGIGTAAGQKQMVESRVTQLNVPIPPILHFYELNDDRVTPDFRLLRSLRTPDLQLVRMNSMSHVHFSSDGFASIMLPEMAKVTKAGPDLKQEVQKVAEQTLAFLDKYTSKAKAA